MKKIIALLAFMASMSSFGCWYMRYGYSDYIYSVNDTQIITITTNSNVISYSVKNNTVVDFPITISAKLISDQTVILPSGEGEEFEEILRCSIQYRVLPNGSWTTAVNYNTPSGTIKASEPPKTYFGKNSIWPQNLKAGDVVMIRMYITDALWQSGDIKSNCSDKISYIRTPFGMRYTLPYTFSYQMTRQSLVTVDLGGSWYPHFVTTVIYSGNERPLR